MTPRLLLLEKLHLLNDFQLLMFVWAHTWVLFGPIQWLYIYPWTFQNFVCQSAFIQRFKSNDWTVFWATFVYCSVALLAVLLIGKCAVSGYYKHFSLVGNYATASWINSFLYQTSFPMLSLTWGNKTCYWGQFETFSCRLQATLLGPVSITWTSSF